MPEMSNDEVLEYLVQKVEETAIGFSVTLNVNGLVIVGEPIRSELYYDHLSRLFDTYTEKSEGGRRENIVISKANDPTEFKALDNYYKDWKEFMIKLRDKKDKNNGKPTHIHLQNVEIWEVFSTEPFRFKYWRGKISSIDGFSVDRVSEDNQLPGTT
jgi:hypothetical protein